MAANQCEFLGSGYAQLIGPLVPAAVNDANLRIGNTVYRELLGMQPSLAYVNEQAFSSGLIAHYLANGYRAILSEWDNPASLHPEWPQHWHYLPQYAVDGRGREIPLLWSNSIAFQSLQRYAHGELEEDTYQAQLDRHLGDTPRAFCLYANDAEIFNYRPGRFSTEPTYDPERDEWGRVTSLFERLRQSEARQFVLPSKALMLMEMPGAANRLILADARQPVVVKKQPKYNLVRWAVTGRDDAAINGRCRRIYLAIKESTNESWWRRLCYLWSSDFRTHITDARWASYLHELATTERELGLGEGQGGAEPIVGTKVEPNDCVDIETKVLRLRLNTRRGLAIQGLWLPGHAHPLLGTLAHGFFDDIELAADWYSGHMVYEPAGRHKVTDLVPVTARQFVDADDGALTVEAEINTDFATVRKRFKVAADKPVLSLDYHITYKRVPFGSLRLAYLTLCPEAWDRGTLYYATYNGGSELEVYPLVGNLIGQDASVSALVSARGGFGLGDGTLVIGDKDKSIQLTVDPIGVLPLGLIRFQETANSFLYRVGFSLSETDDTRNAVDGTSCSVASFLIEVGGAMNGGGNL